MDITVTHTFKFTEKELDALDTVEKILKQIMKNDISNGVFTFVDQEFWKQESGSLSIFEIEQESTGIRGVFNEMALFLHYLPALDGKSL